MPWFPVAVFFAPWRRYVLHPPRGYPLRPAARRDAPMFLSIPEHNAH